MRLTFQNCLKKKRQSMRKTPIQVILTSFIDNMIDGEALLSLTERGLELLIPQVGKRMKFLKKIDELKNKSKTAEPSEAPTNVDENDPDHECSSATVLAEQTLVAEQRQGSPTPKTQQSKLVPTHFKFHKAPSNYPVPISI